MPRHSGGLVVVSHAVTTLSAASTMQAVSDAATPAGTASDAATFRFASSSTLRTRSAVSTKARACDGRARPEWWRKLSKPSRCSAFDAPAQPS